MAISDTITSMYENVGNVYDVLELAGADLTNVDKNIENLKQSWEERLLYFLANGTDVVWNNWLPKVTGTGETITLNNTIEAKMDFVYKGNTSQKTTTGKNLFDVNLVTSVTNGSISDGVITIASDKTNSTIKFTNLSLSAGTYYISADIKKVEGGKTFVNLNDGANVYNNVINPTLSTSYQRYQTSYTYSSSKSLGQIFANFSNAEGTINIKNIMLSTSSDSTYEPYTNGASPNPDYPQDIQVVSGDNTIKVEGKNLVNYDNNTNLENKYLNASGSFESAIYTYVNGTIKANSNKITISFNNSVGQGYVRIGEYKEDGTFIKRTLVSTTPTTLTLDSNTSYLIYSIDKNSDNYFEKLQLEKGNQATTYEPYQSQSYPINIGNIELCKIGTHQDKIYKDNDKWYLNKQIGKVVLDGSETGWNGYIQDGVINCFNNSLITFTNQNGFSNYFTLSTDTSYSNTKTRLILFKTLRGLGIYASINIFATLAQFKTWLSTHNTTLYYVLVTPTTTEITDTTLISQLEAIKKSYNNQTSISQVNNDLPFELDVVALGELESI